MWGVCSGKWVLISKTQGIGLAWGIGVKTYLFTCRLFGLDVCVQFLPLKFQYFTFWDPIFSRHALSLPKLIRKVMYSSFYTLRVDVMYLQCISELLDAGLWCIGIGRFGRVDHKWFGLLWNVGSLLGKVSTHLQDPRYWSCLWYRCEDLSFHLLSFWRWCVRAIFAIEIPVFYILRPQVFPACREPAKTH